MYYNLINAPAVIKMGAGILQNLDDLLHAAHLHFPHKILVTQKELFDLYQSILPVSLFKDVVFVQGGVVDEANELTTRIKNQDALVLAFGGGSVLDIVKYCASRADVPYITIPSALSNDAVYSCVARLTDGGKKKSFGVQPPIGIIVDFEVIRKAPRVLLLAGVADIVSNLSALKDWKLAHANIGEPINELAFMLSKESVMPLLRYQGQEVVFTDGFLHDLTNAIVTSGLSMIIAGSTRGTSGAEHLISHAIDAYYPERATIHGLQVGWAHLMVEKRCRNDEGDYMMLENFFDGIGLMEEIRSRVRWGEEEFDALIPRAITMRKRYTIFNKI